MALIFYALLLLIGLVFLWWTGEKTINYTQKISAMYQLNTFFLGFVLLAVSTGLPELSIAIQSLWSKTPTLSVGDIIGSNFFDIALVLGLPTVAINTIYIDNKDYINTIFMLGLNTIIMSFIFLAKTLTWLHGLFFILIYLGSCWYLWKSQKKQGLITEMVEGVHEIVAEPIDKKTKTLVFLSLFLSLVGVLLASKLCVFSAITLVKATPLTFELVGATIIAIGTSLPEITLSIIAVRRKDYALAIGNSLGSVLEQGTLILGILALFSGTPIQLMHIKWITPFFYAAIIIVGFGIIVRKKINLLEGALLLLLSGTFLAYSYISLLF